MNERDDNSLTMFRDIVVAERTRRWTKQSAAGHAADSQLPLLLSRPDPARALLVSWNLTQIGLVNRRQTKLGRVALGDEARQPAQGGSLEGLGLALADDDAHGEGVRERHARKLGGSGADDRQVLGLEGSEEPRVGAAVARHSGEATRTSVRY